MAMNTLKDIYIDQLQDLYSANRQSLEATKKLADHASNDKLKAALERGVDGIQRGIDAVAEIVCGHDEDPTGEFCKGMEGLVKEVHAHVLNADFLKARSAAINVVKTLLENRGFTLSEPIYRVRLEGLPAGLGEGDGASEAPKIVTPSVRPKEAVPMPEEMDVTLDDDVRRQVAEERARGEQEDLLSEQRPME